MADLETVTLQTVPSTWRNSFAGHFDAPYRRVVGMHHGSGTLAGGLARIDDAHPETVYDLAEAATETLHMDMQTAGRMLGFFCRYFVEEPRHQPRYNRIKQYSGERFEDYNCHRFGYWMRGMPAAQGFENPEAPDHITERYPFEGSLPMGRHGVLGTPGAAVHSVVGLGEDTDECIQVFAFDGFMGIDTYEHAVDHVDYMRVKGMKIYV